MSAPVGHAVTTPKACGVDVGFGFRCLRERGHVGFHTWDPKRLLGEEPIPLSAEQKAQP